MPSPALKNQIPAKPRGAQRRVPAPTAQDGALGAGGTSALVVISNYVFSVVGAKIPAEVLAAVAPFFTLGLTYLLAVVKHWNGRRRERDEIREYEREVDDLINNMNISEEIKQQLKADREKILLLKIEEKRHRIMFRHTEIVSALNASSSEI